MNLRKQALLLIIGSVFILFTESCGTQSKFASSFGKRRYNKGFYWDKSKSIEPAVAVENLPLVQRPALSNTEKALLVPAVKACNNSPTIINAAGSSVKKTENKPIQLLTTVVIPNIGRNLPVAAISSINIDNQDIAKDTGKGIYSLSGFALCIAGLCLFIFGSDIGTMLLIAILIDVAGILLSIYAVAIIDKYDAFAMIGLALNALILGLTFAVRL